MCSICTKYGHEANVCRKKKKKDTKQQVKPKGEHDVGVKAEQKEELPHKEAGVPLVQKRDNWRQENQGRIWESISIGTTKVGPSHDPTILTVNSFQELGEGLKSGNNTTKSDFGVQPLGDYD